MQPFIFHRKLVAPKAGTYTITFPIPEKLKFVMSALKIHFKADDFFPQISVSRVGDSYIYANKTLVDFLCSVTRAETSDGDNLEALKEFEDITNFKTETFIGGDSIDITIKTKSAGIYSICAIGERGYK